jgi:acyl-CoA reductase-like NAD-dependent aldehyde dehydrogenase
MRLFHEEVFGPVTPVYKFSTDDGEAPPAVHSAAGRRAWLRSGLRLHMCSL